MAKKYSRNLIRIAFLNLVFQGIKQAGRQQAVTTNSH